MWFGRKVLGLALEGRSILAAQVRRGRSGPPRLTAAAEFVFPDVCSLDEPVRLGKELGRFLRENGFSARRAALGVPTEWIILREKVFPPAGPAELGGMVRLEAERGLAGDVRGLLVDYVGGRLRGGAKDGRVLICAVPREKAERLLAVAHAAGLRPAALLPSAAALGALVAPESASMTLLRMGRDRLELVLRSGGRLRSIRRLPAGCLGALSGEAGRGGALASLVRLALSAAQENASEPDTLFVMDDAGAGEGALRELSAAVGFGRTVLLAPSDMGFADGDVPVEVQRRCAPAVALALVHGRAEGSVPDLLRSPVQGEAKRIDGRRAGWIAAGAASIACLVAVPLLSVRAEERELHLLRERLEEMQPDIAAARAVVDQVATLRGWTDRRPRFLEVLRELTLASPVERPIWITNVAVRGDMRVVATGKSPDERAVLELLDSLRRRPAFGDVDLLYMRAAGGGRGDVAFSIRFQFRQVE